MKITDMPLASALDGSEVFEVVQNGQSKQCSILEIMAAQPDANGIYPDVPLNRVVIKRYSMQTSTVAAVEGNLKMIDMLVAKCFPVLLDSNSLPVAYLNGSDMTKTVDGLPATLDDPTMQVMARLGGWWQKYEYDASTNEKLIKLSVYKVRGYRYVRRRYRGCFNATVSDGKLLSNSGLWTTQSVAMQNYHTYAKATGDHYREIAISDHECIRNLFWLIHKTYNSQSVYRGIADVSNWSKFSQAGAGGQSTYGQMHKTGITLDIKGHEGEKEITVTSPDDDTMQITCKPNKFLWCENAIGGMYWLWATQYLKKDGIWYRCNDLDKIAFSVTNDYEAVCEQPSGSGYILETFEDTMIPTAVGASETTGYADYFYRQTTDTAGQVYVPALGGGAGSGGYCGVSTLDSDYVPSTSGATFGGALASDDPTDTTAEGTVAG
jgi:hypothetical protein